jgi:hypothetical protein
MNINLLLSFMLFSYLLPILFVFYNYNSNNSVSNIICNNNCKNYILFFMFLMGIGTLLYEYERDDLISQIIISILLSGLYGLIYINESHKIHYFFAFLVFVAILFFMIRHCYLTNCNSILLLSLYFEIVTLLVIMIDIKKNNNIFYSEIFYILNFAFYYLYLHFIE